MPISNDSSSMAAGVCDVCGTAVGNTGGCQISAAQMNAIADAGFNPYEHYPDLAGPAAMFGASMSDQLISWRETVAQSTTDWRLCLKCTTLTQTSLDAKQAPLSSVSNVRRDQANDELRSFFYDINLGGPFTAPCDFCGILLIDDKGFNETRGKLAGLGMMMALNDKAQSVVKFLVTMKLLLGDEFLPNVDLTKMQPTGLAQNIDFLWKLLKHFTLRTHENGRRLCPACDKQISSKPS